MFQMLGKWFGKGIVRAGLKAGTGKRVVSMVGNAALCVLGTSVAAGAFLKTGRQFNALTGEVPRPQVDLHATIPPPPNQGGPAHAHVSVHGDKGGKRGGT